MEPLMRLTKLSRVRLLWQRRRVRVVSKTLLAGGLALVVLSYFGIPPLLRWAIERQGSLALGREVTVARVQFNPLILSARIEGLRIAEADGKSEFLSLGALSANLSVSSIWHRGLVLDALCIEQPVVHLVHLEPGRFNFSDILERFAAQPKAEPAASPARFSLNNIELLDGRIEFDDHPAGRVHKIEQLGIGVPFVSSLPTRTDNFVEPKLEARINGAEFRLQGQMKLFSDHREASLNLGFEPFDVIPYLVYVPGKLPVKIERARLASDLRLVWAEASEKQPASLVLSGKLSLSDVALKDPVGAPLFAVETLGVDIERFEALANPMVVRLNQVQIDSPSLDVSRAKNGQVNLVSLSGLGKPVPKTGNEASALPPLVFIDKLLLSKGRVRWHDEAVPGAYNFVLSPLEVELSKLDLGNSKPARLKLTAQGGKGEKFSLDAQLDVKAGRYNGHLATSKIVIETLRPYYAAAFDRAQLRGEGALEGDFKITPGKDGSAVRLDKVVLNVKDFTLGELNAKEPLVRLPISHAEGVSVDLATREVNLGRYTNQGARVMLARDKNGTLNLVSLLQSHSVANERAKEVLQDKLQTVASAAVAVAPPAVPDAAWRLKLESATLTGGSVHFDDRSGSTPVAMNITELGLRVKDWSNQPGVQAKAELQARVNKTGIINIGGQVGTEPLKGALRLDLRKVEFLPVQPYIDDLYRILITRGNLSMRGNLAFDLGKPDKPDIRYAGMLAVEDFNSLDRLNDTDFMRWKRFTLDQVSLQTQPLAFRTHEIRLEDFYTRLILDAQGRLNVRELAANEQHASQPSAAASSPVGASLPMASDPLPAKSSGPQLQVKIDKIAVANGHVNYIDRFVKPNYEANLLALNGSLSGLSSNQDSVATLDLKASMDGSAPVTIAGELNPFRQDSFLDIQAGVRDVDLTGVSTYAAKFVGYGIDKGKLSMAVQYKIRDRTLSAQNRVTLDQLTFGQKVESPSATKLPVLFAVSLLKDRHGVIDINLPISGSLDDPQFSVGGVILRVITNLIGKAATAPFALIGSMFGGGEELSFLDFEPGSALIRASAEEKL
ncbi:MAG: hypothetical protein H6R19_1985, partial [Proteobacteria bacterium]|nr:hypothetical protein [Pseudomonadota bacterium]